MTHATVESGLKLPISLLFSARRGHSARGGAVNFTCPIRGPGGRVLFIVDLHPNCLSSVQLIHVAEGALRTETVGLEVTEQRLGGVRWWYSCPVTWRRCATLYLPPGATRFASQQAHRLAYASQRMAPTMREIHRLWKGITRLGGSVNVSDPLPPRPAGMRRATYARERARLEALRREVLDPARYRIV